MKDFSDDLKLYIKGREGKEMVRKFKEYWAENYIKVQNIGSGISFANCVGRWKFAVGE